ncbi:hypothetical protein Tco_1393608 [Tanacetum coccineum]
MWLFRHKYNADGTLSRYKAHLVANGSTQLAVLMWMRHLVRCQKRLTIRIVLSLSKFLDIGRFTSLMSRMPFYMDRYQRLYTCTNLLVSGIRSIQIMFAFSRDLFLGLNRPLGPGFKDLWLMLLGLGFIIVIIITSLHAEFSMTDLGSLNAYHSRTPMLLHD